ncbi:MAG TPA: isopentenyl phosphate kinase [Anaerolineales bacterium]|nr:isopentenyl phosphate kinase [Anaerolineales bacterium]
MMEPLTPTSGALLFLKLGGSLITEKTRARTLRKETLERLADEIAVAYYNNPGLRLVLGNGAGSFGHVTAKKYRTRQGVHTPADWRGFVEVWREAATLSHHVALALQEAGLPAIVIHPSSSVIAEDGRVESWDTAPLRAALQAGLVPLIHGDVIFDTVRGGTILSTEDLFGYLAYQLEPGKVLLAGLEAGVWADYPVCSRMFDLITPANLAEITPALSGSRADDVTGGMLSKVQQSLQLAIQIPGLEVLIFSGDQPGDVVRALSGENIGTVLRA